MHLDISHALKAPGVSFGFDVRKDLEPMSAGGENIRFPKPVEISGSYVFTGENFFLRGVIRADYEAGCCRCLRQVHSHMEIPFSEEFAREEDETHPDRYLFQGETVDLTQMAGDLISLNTPMRHLCREDCKGLCPVCGADRNETDCGHAAGGDETVN